MIRHPGIGIILSKSLRKSKPLKKSAGLNPYLLLLLTFLLFGSCWACFSRITLEPIVSLKIDPKEYQPVALLPVQPATGQPDSGSSLFPFIQDSLQKKGYTLVEEAAVSLALEEMDLTPQLLISDPDSRMKFGERLKAKLMMIGTLPEYRVQKSRWGSEATETWNSDSFSEVLLPAYFRGSSEIRLILRLFESKKGDLVWRSEGVIRVSSDSAESYDRKLAERLLENLPPASPPSAK
jgi:hypothetical protein